MNMGITIKKFSQNDSALTCQSLNYKKDICDSAMWYRKYLWGFMRIHWLFSHKDSQIVIYHSSSTTLHIVFSRFIFCKIFIWFHLQLSWNICMSSLFRHWLKLYFFFWNNETIHLISILISTSVCAKVLLICSWKSFTVI